MKNCKRLVLIGSVAAAAAIGVVGSGSPASALPAGWSEGVTEDGNRILYDGHGNYIMLA